VPKFSCKIASTDEKNGKIYKLTLHERKLHSKCISGEATTVKIVVSKFLVIMKTMTEHKGGHFGDNQLISGHIPNFVWL